MPSMRANGYCSSVKYTRQGAPRGGGPMSPGTVYGILRNPFYVGDIRGKGTNYPGIHEPIISRNTWEAAQALSASRQKRPADSRDTKHFLAGLLWDDLGRNMRLDLNWHRGTTYCAYVSSNAAWSQREYRRAYRCNADNLDKLVLASVSDCLCDRGRFRSALKGLGISDQELDQLAQKGKMAVKRLGRTPPVRLEELFAALLYRIKVGEEKLSICFRSLELRRFLLWDDNSAFRGRPADWPCSDAR